MLLDTYVLIALSTRAHGDHEAVRAFVEGRSGLVVSALTYVEFMGWLAATPYDLALRETLYRKMTELPIDREVCEVAAALRRRRASMKTPDAVIAATALVYGLPVVTTNVRDFDWIDELAVVDPTA